MGYDWITYRCPYIGYLIDFDTIINDKLKRKRFYCSSCDEGYDSDEENGGMGMISRAWEEYLEKHDLAKSYKNSIGLKFSKFHTSWSGTYESEPMDGGMRYLQR